MITRLRLPVLCICALLAAAGAQAAPAASAGGAPEPVLGHIPAGNLGFVAIHEAGGFAGKIDKFLDDIGVGQMLAQPDPQDPNKTVRIPLIDMARGAMQLGEGFDPRGGLAVVMLDPNDFGIDLLKMMGLAGQEDQPAPAPAQPQEKKLPFVIFLPGRGIQQTLGAYQPQQEGKYMKVMLPVGPMLAGQCGGYIALSPMAEALDRVLGSKRKAVADIPAEQVTMLAKADLAYYVNCRKAGPLLSRLLGVVEQQMQAGGMPPEIAPMMSMYFRFYGDIVRQLDDISVGGRFVETGLVFDEMVSFQPGTRFGKLLAGTRPTGQAKLDALPDLPYVLAGGSVGDDNPDAVSFAQGFIEDLLKAGPLAGLPEEQKTRLRKLVKDSAGEVTSMQFVGGGAPAGSGLFGLSFVIRCKDAAKMKALLAEEARLIEGIIHHFGGEDEDVQKLQVRYVKGVETVGSVSVDAVSVTHPDLDTMDEDERAEMKKVLGEDKIRYFIAAPDKKTVVVTFGGSRAFLAEALKVAGGSGRIGKDTQTAEALKYLPKNPTFVMLLNGANLYQVIVTGMKTMEPDAELPPFKVTCRTPVAVGAGLEGDSAHVAFYIPTNLVKEVVGIFMMFAGGGPGAAAGPGDF